MKHKLYSTIVQHGQKSFSGLELLEVARPEVCPFRQQVTGH
jgi:hypothetical protein